MSNIIQLHTITSKDNSSNNRMSSINLCSTDFNQIEELECIEHDAQPFKSLEDINRIVSYLRENERWRDQMLFVLGINFGLRCSDIRMLKFSDLINTDGTFKEDFCVLEKKTSTTRKRKKYRHLTVNLAVMEAVELYLQHNPNKTLNDYLFVSESGRKGNNQPLQRYSVERIIKGIARELHIEGRYATHSLRKTFGYHIMMQAQNNADRQILLLMSMFNHSSVQQTLRYIGITADEMREGYDKLNLGLVGKSAFDVSFVKDVG